MRAEVGKRNGVRRILPSDFALDLFKATPGEHMMFDLRRTADEKIASTGMSFWGDGARPIEVTSVEDTARMAARVALDWTVASGKFAFAGDRISIVDAADIVEQRTGRRFKRIALGNEAELRTAMAEARKDSSDPFKSVMLAYQLYMLTGQTALTDSSAGGIAG